MHKSILVALVSAFTLLSVGSAMPPRKGHEVSSTDKREGHNCSPVQTLGITESGVDEDVDMRHITHTGSAMMVNGNNQLDRDEGGNYRVECMAAMTHLKQFNQGRNSHSQLW